jgi:hypothetical protein
MRRLPPSLDPSALDPRSSPYRDRAGRIRRPNGSLFAEVYLKTEVYWQRSGHLWRLHWIQPNETLHGYLEFASGKFEDFVTPVSMLVEEIDRWNRGLWTLVGGPMRVEWLDDEQTAKLRAERGYEGPGSDAAIGGFAYACPALQPGGTAPAASREQGTC